MIVVPLVKGFMMGAGLIVAIGAQNAYVLKQGIKRQHRFLTALTCASCDAILIVLGVAGIGMVSENYPLVETILRWGGALFLFAYGARSLMNAFKPQALLIKHDNEYNSKLNTLLMSAAFSFLNPHAYVDTFLLLGSVGAQHATHEQLPFTVGALCASFVWFFSLSFAASSLSSVFKNPRAWQILDTVIGFTMFAIGFNLIINS